MSSDRVTTGASRANGDSHHLVSSLLSVRNLSVEVGRRPKATKVVEDVSFEVYPGETLGIVGESGAGKSMTALSLVQLLPKTVTGVAGEVEFAGRDLLKLSQKSLRQVRGGEISVVFQNPMSSLNPTVPVGQQISETLRVHDGSLSRQAIQARVLSVMDAVGIPNARARREQYPYQLSGGMQQRVMIAMAMANDPQLIIADEPTTALDVTIQAQIVDVLREAQRETGAALILITHDLGMIAEMADRVLVMYAGRVVEQADVQTIFDAPRHPYTLALLESRPTLRTDFGGLRPIDGQAPSPRALPTGCTFHPRCPLQHGRADCADIVPPLYTVDGQHVAACHHFAEMPYSNSTPQRSSRFTTATPMAFADSETDRHPDPPPTMLALTEVTKHYPINNSIFARQTLKRVHAVDKVSLSLAEGETLGLVGESGCGKSTLAKLILGLERVTSGRVSVLGEDVTDWKPRQMRPLRRRVQAVFQDPFSSLDFRMRVGEVIAEPMKVHRRDISGDNLRSVSDLLELVGLRKEDAKRYPTQFSGGQRQRIGIARALALNPRLVILDEPTSALDVSVQAQIVSLLMDLQNRLGISYFFISHDLSLVKQMAHRVAVMYAGKIVEQGSAKDIFSRAQHPYTHALLASVPASEPNERRQTGSLRLPGDLPDPTNPPSGCRFRTRCWKAQDVCAGDEPDLLSPGGDDHSSACYFPETANVDTLRRNHD